MARFGSTFSEDRRAEASCSNRSRLLDESPTGEGAVMIRTVLPNREASTGLSTEKYRGLPPRPPHVIHKVIHRG